MDELVPELQEYVDNGQMKMRPAVELSYLDEETQWNVVDRIIETEAFPSHDQAIRIRKAFEEDNEIRRDMFHPISADARREMESAVITAYNAKIEKPAE